MTRSLLNVFISARVCAYVHACVHARAFVRACVCVCIAPLALCSFFFRFDTINVGNFIVCIER